MRGHTIKCTNHNKENVRMLDQSFFISELEYTDNIKHHQHVKCNTQTSLPQDGLRMPGMKIKKTTNGTEKNNFF
jgi:hypothetical protein